MTSPPAFLLDCDPGIDDAFALMCAFTYGDVRAITSVSGNVGIDTTTRNARYLVELSGNDIPIHRGASAPLAVTRELAEYAHGASGLGPHQFAEPTLSESPMPATEAILNYCSTGDATIVATGPLTNIALAIQADPTVVERISHLYWMGGSISIGNVTEHAEFNAWADPHAVDLTFRSGVPLTMFGLNLTHQVRLGEDAIAQLQDAATPTALIFAELLRFYYESGGQHPIGKPIHDPCAVLGLTHPELFQVTESNMVAHMAEDERRGKTEQMMNNTDGTHRVAIGVDAPAVIDLVMAAAIDPRVYVSSS